ncbi:MAG TPA: hypothetical protein IAA15_02690 [Candidatus Olsenella pullicola]|nr:hypothetical protein [Candidatus Olsenella pullicola]
MRFYGVSLDEGGKGVSWRDMAAMVAHLPSESALRREEGDGWSEAERLLAQIADSAYIAWWQRIDHDNPDAPPLRRVLSPRERAERADAAREDVYTRADMDRIADALGIPEDRR